MKGYQLKIAIKNSKTPIWRRCVVPAGLTFSQLSMILNEVMGWTGSHLFSYEFDHLKMRIKEINMNVLVEGMQDQYDLLEASKIDINEFMESEKQFTYTYGFDNDWQHCVAIEKVLRDAKDYPQVVKYKGSCPPEDSGDSDGYDRAVVNAQLKKLFTVTLGEGETRRQSDIYQEFSEGHRGIRASQNAKNTKNTILAAKHRIKSENNLDDSEELMNKLIKEQKKPNQPFKIEFSLSLIYSFYPEKEILEIARLHGLPSYNDYNKSDLVRLTAAHLLKPEVMTAFFLCLRDVEIQEFERLIADRENSKGRATEHSEYIDRIASAGYCSWDKFERPVLTEDVVHAYKKINMEALKSKRVRRSFLLDCLMAAAFLYGTAPLSVIAEMYHKNTGETITEDEIEAEVAAVPPFFACFEITDGWFAHANILENQECDEIKALQDDLDYYIPTKIEIQSLAENYGQIDDWTLEELVRFFKDEIGLSADEAEFDGRIIQRNIAAGGDMAIIRNFIENQNIHTENREQLKKMVEHIIKLWNNTRMILNRGFKPSELRGRGGLSDIRIMDADEREFPKFQMRRNQKVDPDAPCPCGSGIKYKYCCGKN